LNQRFTILLVEDEESDVLLIERAFRKHIEGELHVTRNGEEAIEYLTGKGKFSDRKKYPFPDLVISDLKMPKLSGFELLAWIHEHREFRAIPTIVLSSSKLEHDVIRAYELGARTYMVKPSDFQTLAEMVKVIRDYWAASMKPNLRGK
jgi:CheY-like chemotaxis protein